jgi:hypothetical protein
MAKKRKSEPFLNQNVIIAIIGAVATIVAASIPFLINMNKAEPASTFTPVPPTDVPTFTSVPPTPTEAFTPTPEPPTATATFVTETPVMGFFDVYLAIDPAGEVKSTTFPSERPVYVIFKINDPTDQGNIRATWRAVEVPGIDANSVVWTEDYIILKSKGTVQAGGHGAWRPGKYEVDLYLNGILSSTQEFEVTN